MNAFITLYAYDAIAQIYNEISDYEALAAALKQLLKKQDEIIERLWWEKFLCREIFDTMR